MIGVERIKKLLMDPDMSYEQAEDIRDGFRALVEDIIFPAWLEKNNHEKHKSGA